MTCKISVQVPAKINLPRRMMYEATKCQKHEVVSIKIPLEGYPQPDLTWTLQGAPINNDARHTVMTTSSFTTLLFARLDNWFIMQ